MNTSIYKPLCHFLISLCLFSYGSAALSITVETSFEFDDTTGSFTIGTDPDAALFTNGESRSIGVLSLYHSGSHAWTIDSGKTGQIEFSRPVEKVSFFFRDQNSSVDSELTLFDASGNQLQTFNGTSSSWTEVNLSAPDTASQISNVTLKNNGNTGLAVIDDLTFVTPSQAPDPDPGSGQKLENPIPETIEFGASRVRLRMAASGLTAPNWGVAAPGDKEHLYVSDQHGILWKINLISGEKSVFLDLSNRLVALGIFGENSFDERGFLGLAFHPEYASNGLLYTYTSEPAVGVSDFSTLPVSILANHKSVILEWKLNIADNMLKQAEVISNRKILEIDQPQFNHDGGGLAFGPDGFLYIALGDGGGADDLDGQEFIGGPIAGHGDGNGQNPLNPLGSLLRIDPAESGAGNGQYGIPEDNPFTGQAQFLDEIFAFGFRNPFRFSFDTEGGNLYLADVGQNDIEEVNIVTVGGNYGWNRKEGSFLFNPNANEDGFVTLGPGPADTIDPIVEYDHDEGSAIIGGFVYRGYLIPDFNGKYLFGDFESPVTSNGRLFYVENNQIREIQLTLVEKPDFKVMGFARDAHGEIYVLGNRTGVPFGNTGLVMKIVSNSIFDGSLVIIPAVEVRDANGTTGVYQAKLRLVPGSTPLRFELIAGATRIDATYRGDNAVFRSDNGKLTLPFVNFPDAQGNIMTWSAELQLLETSPGLSFELTKATLIK